ncbi:MAG: NADH-quinone oxidoreductase subunit H [Sulfurospirillum sp.]|nr:NADH-quinone oxidoreductase subunit H [Sulfurospirillum sp.]MBL0702594.1 NADH-quinone oxidoreductase subunit H [Sulfurospirillum sp.]
MSTALISIVIFNIIVALIVSLVFVPVLVWMERRVAGFIQDRLGPNRCHIGGLRLGGLVQSFADMIKLVFKEDYVPNSVKEKMLFRLSPAIVFATAYLSFMVIPFADDLNIDGKSYIMQALPIEFGILWILAFAGLGVYGLMLGGWASNNKYSLLGGIRAAAQVVSYEAVMGLSLISMLIVYGSTHFGDMVRFQGELIWGIIPAWGVIIQPVAAILFIVTAFAETNRSPFDIAEGESEIVGGFHTEYSAMGFGLFFVGEYIAMGVASALIVTIFFGGYQIPWLNTAALYEHINMVFMVIIVVLPLVSYVFARWIKKNNVWHKKDDVRNKETRWLIIGLIGVNILVIFTLLLFLLFGLEENGINISVALLQVMTFVVKLLMVNFFFIWVRWTLVRFRYDQLQNLAWKVLLPIAIANIFITGIFVVALGV